jgi:hypothetical protein
MVLCELRDTCLTRVYYANVTLQLLSIQFSLADMTLVRRVLVLISDAAHRFADMKSPLHVYPIFKHIEAIDITWHELVSIVV